MESIQLTRRQFLKTSVAGGAFVLSVNLPSVLANGAKQSSSWCVYVTINPNNTVTMSSPVMDMGQHMKTTGPMIIADELDLDWHLIEFTTDCPAYMKRDEDGNVTHAHADMGTGGSHAVRRNWDYMRRAGAIGKRMLVEEAAERWQVTPDSLTAKESVITHNATGRTFTYGQLAAKAGLRKIDESKVKLKERNDYHIMGKSAHTVDLKEMVTGKPLFGLDADYKNALQVVIHRAPALGASVANYDKDAALAIPGVVRVVEVARRTNDNNDKVQEVAGGIAVVATNLWAAMQGKAALNTKWKPNAEFENQSSEQQFEHFHDLVHNQSPTRVLEEDGNVEAALQQAAINLNETYETPLFAHACMEPFNCIADIRDGEATVVVGHQFPNAVAREVERLTGIDALKVEVISKRMGGGFGRRYINDFVTEAVLLSQQLKHPVKVTWTREDEIERDFFAPAYVMRIQAGTDEDGKLRAWHHTQAQTNWGAKAACFPKNLVENYKCDLFEDLSHIPIGPWRGPGHLQWAFASESMIDELAIILGKDPLQYRLDMLKPHKEFDYNGWGAEKIHSGRMAKCFEKAAQMAGWGRKMPEGHGLGIAGHFTFGSYSAFVVEVSVKNNAELRIEKAWGTIDCGFAINPNHIKNQMEGGFIDGLNAALFNKVNVEKGQAMNNNFHTLRWMKMAESPVEIESHIMQNDYAPMGVGEPPTAPAAAALTNAIFAACGKRVRRLPVADEFTI